MTDPKRCPNLLSKTGGKWTKYRCKTSEALCSRKYSDASDHIRRADHESGE
jgi:hypothetical protein